MNKILKISSVWLLSSFWLLALLNPVFKKYDYGAEWPMVILLGVLCFVLFLLNRREKVAMSRSIVFEKSAIFVFLIFATLSFVFSQTQNVGFNELMAFASCFSVYLIFAYRENLWARKFLKLVAAGAMIACGVGFFIYLFREAPSRMIGPFFNIFYASNLWPNAFALFLVSVWPIFILMSDDGKTNSKYKSYFSVLWLAGLAMVFAALFLTYSRGALITALFQAVLLIFYFAKRINFNVIKRTVFVFLLAILITMSANFIRQISFNNDVVSFEDKITFQNQESLTSVKERADYWKGAWALALERPLVGYGPFSFRYVYEAKEQKDLLAIADHPHNVFLKIAAENGLITLAAFVLFLGSIFFIFVRNFRKLKDRHTKDLSYVLFVSVAGAFGHNMIDYNFNFLANILLVFVYLALLRSLFVQNSYTECVKRKFCKNIFTFLLSLIICLLSIYEGGILVLAKLSNEDFRAYSFYPREYYSKVAGQFSVLDPARALEETEKQLSLNPYDSDTWYLQGEIYSNDNRFYSSEKALVSFAKAIENNPYNNFSYYSEYLTTLKISHKDLDVKNLEIRIKDLLNKYVPLAKNNVHFTSYTPDAEIAASLYKELEGSNYLQDIIEKQRASRK